MVPRGAPAAAAGRLATLQGSTLVLTQMQDLVEYVEASQSDQPVRLLRGSEESIGEVLLEIDRDGARYALVRTALPAEGGVSLSPRELAIARLIAQGMGNKTIGALLEISPWTVATHLRRIFSKLGVSSRAAMVAQLLEHGALSGARLLARPE